MLFHSMQIVHVSQFLLIPMRLLIIKIQICRALNKLSSLVYLDLHGGFLDTEELKVIQTALGGRVQINKFKFSSVARPTVGPRRSSIWGLRVRD